MKETPAVPASLSSPLVNLPVDLQPVPGGQDDPAEAGTPTPSPAVSPAPGQGEELTLAAEAVQETDAWWGSYSGWTMMPSMVVCLGLTALIAWGSWRLLDRGWVQLSVLTLAGAVWLVQACRWCYRVLGYNYRLTTHRLFLTKGILYEPVEVNLASVAKVEAQRRPQNLLANIGNVCLTLEGPGRPRVILEGIGRPRQVAEHIRKLSEQARGRQITTARIS